MTEPRESLGPIPPVDYETDGAILNLYSELPDSLDMEALNMAYLELDANIQGYKDPPIASLEIIGIGYNVEDYRCFYVDFKQDAALEDITGVITIVANAIKRYRADS